MKYKLKYNLPHEAATCLGWLLDARGVEDIESYVNPTAANELDPYLLDNIGEAAAKLIEHLERGNKILLIVDADADGATSASMLWNYVKEAYPFADLSFICHEHKGHGFGDLWEEVDKQHWDLILVPDAGSNDYEFHKYFKDKGTDIICIDHHEVENGYSKDAIVVNNQSSTNYSNKSFCGAGIVYKFLMVLDDMLKTPGRCRKYMDLCALGNIADCMSMKHPETRYYITEGLKVIHNRGLQAFIDQQNYSLFKETNQLGYINVAFYIAPLINAVVRVGTMEEKRMLFEAFTDPDKQVITDKRGAAFGATERVCVEMARRASNAKNKQNRIKEKATEQLDAQIHKFGLLSNNILIIQLGPKSDIPQELRGLICTQFVNRYNRPCAILAKTPEGYWRGSMRGNEAFEGVPNFKEFLENSGCIEYCQGHSNAAGLSVHDTQLTNLINYANSSLDASSLESCYYVDYIFSSNEDFAALLLQVAEHPELWGNDVEEPTVVVEKIPYFSTQWRLMGENKDSCKISVNGVEYVRFKDSDFAQECQQYDKGYITVYGKIKKNTWAGRTTPQILINDYEFEEQNLNNSPIWDF